MRYRVDWFMSLMGMLLMNYVMNHAQEIPTKYAVGKNCHMSIDMRRAHINEQAYMAREQVHPQIKQALHDSLLHTCVQEDLHKRKRELAREQAHDLDSIKLTWQELEDRLNKQQDASFLLIGFGSLVHKDFSYQPNVNVPGVVFGVKRIYNLKHPNPASTIMGLPAYEYEQEELRLNTILTNNQYDIANGLLLRFKVGTDEYEHLKKRECKYVLVPTKVVLYESLLKGEPICVDAYILSGDVGVEGLGLEPHVIYNSIVMDGMKDIQIQGSPGFVPLFLDTTYLSDGKTTIRHWIKMKDQTE